MHHVPVDRRVAEQHAKLAVSREFRVDVAHGAKELLGQRSLQHLGLCRLLGLSQRSIGDVLASNEPIDHVLVASVAAFHHDVVDGRAKSRISNERQSKRVALLITVSAFSERDDGV